MSDFQTGSEWIDGWGGRWNGMRCECGAAGKRFWLSGAQQMRGAHIDRSVPSTIAGNTPL